MDKDWPEAVNDAAVRHDGRRCANRAPAVSKRITSDCRALAVACFMRYALCSASDQLLLMLRRWIKTMANRASRETAPNKLDPLSDSALSRGWNRRALGVFFQPR